MRAELIRVKGETDGRKDMTKLIGASHEYADAPKNALVTICDIMAYACVLDKQAPLVYTSPLGGGKW